MIRSFLSFQARKGTTVCIISLVRSIISFCFASTNSQPSFHFLPVTFAAFWFVFAHAFGFVHTFLLLPHRSARPRLCRGFTNGGNFNIGKERRGKIKKIVRRGRVEVEAVSEMVRGVQGGRKTTYGTRRGRHTRSANRWHGKWAE